VSLEFQIGDETMCATTAIFLLAPAGIPHQVRNLLDELGKLLVVCQPAGF